MRALLLPALLVLLLSGCGDPGSTESPAPPSPSATPVFASEEEALAAAEAAFGAYVEASDEILSDGGTEPTRIRPYVSSDYLNEVIEGYALYAEKGIRATGQTRFDSLSLASYSDDEIDVYLCLDVSGVRIQDESGTDVTPVDRDDRLPLDVQFAVLESGPVVARSDSWSGTDFC